MTTINKPLPHRPFSVAADLEKALRRQHPQMTSVSNLRPYVPANDKFTVPPVPKRAHLVTRSPSPPYYHRAAPDALPSSSPKPSHSFSQSQSLSHSQSGPHSSTADLIPPHLRPTRTPSFWRRHWFVILVCILALLGISVAVGVVLANGKRGDPNAGVYIPASISSLDSSSVVVVPISEVPPIGSASLDSATSPTPAASSVLSAFGTTSVFGNPLPSASPSTTSASSSAPS